MSKPPALLLAMALLLLTGPARGDEGGEFFEKKIRPVLVANCYPCHSTGQKQKANLLLDSRAGILRGGDSGSALVPGQPEQSRLVKAIRYASDELQMPPKGKLADPQIADLITWVKLGAPWPDQPIVQPKITAQDGFNLLERRKHWAFQPLQTSVPPPVRHTDWPRSPADVFVLAGMEAIGLAPTGPADKRTLIRRVTYDLIGLPPTPAEIAAFLADNSSHAYEKVVDRLLASPHYGERWGRHWLDLVRFAETWGHELDFDMAEAYPYRDYVIRALNADVPYDQFVLEHVAGDLLHKPRRHPAEGFNESIIGTAFWFLGEAAHSPVDVRADESDRIDNQIDVMTKAFLGLTVACARCHDHKFDAISSRDYYALSGYLESSRYQRAFLDPPERTCDCLRRLETLQTRSRALAIAISAPRLRERAGELANLLPTMRSSAGWKPTPPAASGAICFEDFKKGTYQSWFVTGQAFGTAPVQTPIALLKADLQTPVGSIVPPGTAHSGLVSNKLHGVLRSPTFVIPRKKIWYHVAGRRSQINLIIDGYQLIRDPIYGGLTLHVNPGDRLEWRSQDVSMWAGQRAYIEIIDDGPGFVALDKIWFSDHGTPPEPPHSLLPRLLHDPQVASPEALASRYQELILETVEQWRSGTLAQTADVTDRVALLNFMLQSDFFAALPDRQVHGLSAEQQSLPALQETYRQTEATLPSPRRAIAMADGTAWNEPVHIRGSHKNLGPEVPRRFLEAIAGNGQPAPSHGSGRLELAQRMIDPSNPLLPRVMVNRLWQHHFGEGLVRSVDNFGILGETPTHRELLDYLSREFVRQGFSIKKMHRLLLLSSTFRMASRAGDRAERLDPQNRLLHRMPIRRLEAESIRDAVLAVSGRLDRVTGGPGVIPYLTPHMAGRGRPEHSGPLDGAGRRSIYIQVRRNFLTPLFLAFDYPIPFTTIGHRTVSNVPAQALTLMNNPFVVQQAACWAECTLARPGLLPEQRIADLYETAYGRPPSGSEVAAARAFLAEQAQSYGRGQDRLAWSDLCHVLLNTKEFIFVP
jgi:hypothetical protein